MGKGADRVVPFASGRTAAAGVSSDNVSGPLSRPLMGRACDPLAFYRAFPDRWMAFLHAHFRDPIHVAFVFGVSDKAARKWWEGVGGPQGDKVGLALVIVPEAAAMLLAA